MSESFLVTGSLGCIGAWTVRLLVKEGARVVSLDARSRHASPAPDHVGRGAGPGHAGRGATSPTSGASRRCSMSTRSPTSSIWPLCKCRSARRTRRSGLRSTSSARSTSWKPLCGGQIGWPRWSTPVLWRCSAPTTPIRTRSRSPSTPIPHPPTHYAVYKLANEGNARIFWRDNGLPSIGLRPMTVIRPRPRPGDDQRADERRPWRPCSGRPFDIPFGGKTLYNYAEDTARALHRGQPGKDRRRSSGEPAGEHGRHERGRRGHRGGRARSEAASSPTASRRLPFPPDIELDPASPVAGAPVTPFEEATALTVALFRAARDAGRLVPAEHGLPD